MNAANKRNGKFSEEARHGFVGLDHEHFNQRVREGVVLRHGVNHMASFVKNQNGNWKIKNKLALRNAALL